MPSLSLSDDDAEPILTEIIQSSGLLLAIDNGERLQFPHLTLQEYFSAEALHDDEQGLLHRFNSDISTWREVDKLRCGKAGDSTNLISSLYKCDSLTAFEGIADAQQIEPTVAETVILAFQKELGTNSDQDRIIQAFPTVTSAVHGRARDVLEFLKSTSTDDSNAEKRTAAIAALALTNLPAAADFLS